MSPLYNLIWKEFTLELRRKSVLAGIGLFLVSLCFICYLTFNLNRNVISAATWSALFWLTILFSVVNAVAKSFIGEKKGLSIYYYQIASPQHIIISKILYNFILSLLLSSTALLVFSILIDNPIEDNLTFFAALFLTSLGFSSSLSLMSSISAKANHSHVLMAVLSFPILIGLLLMAIRITKNTVDGLEPLASYDELLNLLAIDCILTVVAYVLFPYVWRS
jgi:heme exporter protein B